MSTTVTYKGATIATIVGETKKLTTKGTWLEDDISITATPESENGSVYQDEDGYVVLDDEPGVHVSVAPLSVTSNGTYTAPTGIAYSPVSVNVPSGSSSLQSKTRSYIPTETAQSETITADSGYDGLSQVSVSVGAISSTYVGSGVTKQAASTYTPTTTAQTIAAGTYLTGAQTIEAIPSAYVIPSGTITINTAGTYDVKNYASAQVNTSESGGITVDQIATRKISGNIRGNASSIYSYAFYGCNNLTIADFPACTSIGANAFSYCGNLTTANFPSCTSIGANAFFYCTLLTSISFPVCTSIAGSAFYGCSNLATANFPSCTSIGANAFFYCTLLTSISFPVCTSIAGSAFFGCSNLATANFPSCRSIGISAFCRCFNLATVNFPVCTSIGNGAFENCTSLTSISFPVCTYMGTSAFQYCTNLATADFPSCSSIGSYAFRGCTNLTIADLPSCRSIGSYAFSNCTKLISLYLSGISSIPTLANAAAFSSTPIGGYSTVAGRYGSVFVPSSLYESFLTATNWSTISSRIVSV